MMEIEAGTRIAYVRIGIMLHKDIKVVEVPVALNDDGMGRKTVSLSLHVLTDSAMARGRRALVLDVHPLQTRVRPERPESGGEPLTIVIEVQGGEEVMQTTDWKRAQEETNDDP